MLMVDSSIVSVANPTIQRDLGASLTETIWVTSAYLLGVAVPLLVAGRFGDRFGQRNVFIVGMAVFTVASLACGLASSIGVLIAARAIQGVGGSLITPQSQAVLVRIFRPERRGAAMGLWGSVSGIAMLVGPILGGFLVQVAGWQAIFLINVPVGVAGIALAWRFIPKLTTSRPRFDWVGVGLSGVAVFLIVFALQQGAENGWGPVWGPVTIAQLLIAGVVVLGAFIASQLRVRDPLVPLGLFRDRDFALSNATVFCIGVTITGMSLPMLYFVQVARGFDPMLSAVFMIPSAVVGAVLAPFVGSRIVARFGAQRVASFGLLVFAGGLAWYTVYYTPTSNVWLMLIPSAVTGVGSGCMWTPLSMSVTHRLPSELAGAGSAVYNTVRQVGSVLGAALMGGLLNALLVGHGVDPAVTGRHTVGVPLPGELGTAFSTAMGQALLLPCGVAVVGAVLAAFLTGQAGHAHGETDAR